MRSRRDHGLTFVMTNIILYYSTRLARDHRVRQTREVV